MIKSNDSWCKNHLCLIGKDIYESHMLNKVFCLQEECYFCRIERVFPWDMKGQLIMVRGEIGGFRKPAWRHFFLGSWSHAVPGKLGWGCLVVRRTVLVVALTPPVSPGYMWAFQQRLQAPALTGGPEPPPLPRSWGTFCWGCAVPWIARGCCRELRHSRSCFELRPLQVHWKTHIRVPSAVQHGSEK